MSYKAEKTTKINLITRLFATASNLPKNDGDDGYTEKEAVEGLLQAQSFAINLPVEITSTDEYIQLYNAAFNAVSTQNDMLYALSNTNQFFSSLKKYTLDLNTLNHNANTLINDMVKENIVKIPSGLEHIIT